MAAIFDLPVTSTSERINAISIHRVAGPRTCEDSGCYLVAIMYKLRYMNSVHVFPVMAAIFDLLLTVTSDSIHTSPTVSHPENVGLTFWISLLS